MKIVESIRDFIATDAPTYDDDIISDCCGASIAWTDICSDCKEHCGASITCDQCRGQGVRKFFFIMWTCKKCEGEGWVEYDLY